jgi:outer membrane protein OmpA-like peptidoglycan-associated protein
MTNQIARKIFFAWMVCSSALCMAAAQDVPNSSDPAGMKRYEGSELVGYRAPKFDEYLLPLGVPTSTDPPAYKKSQRIEGQVSYYTYVAPEGRTTAELFRNYKQEFARLNLDILYVKDADQPGWFGPTFTKVAKASDIGDILAYNQDEERMVVGKSKEAQPTYYVVFVTAFRDCNMPDRLRKLMTKGRPLAQLVVVSADTMELKMTFVNADDMKLALHDSGKVALYGLYFDTDKDAVKAESQPTLAEIAKLMKADASLRLHVVGHTDNEGKPDYNLELSGRRAANVVAQLTSKYGIAANRLDAFGCGLYAPVASNEAESGRAKNRRVELVRW